MRRATSWTIADLLDFESLVAAETPPVQPERERGRFAALLTGDIQSDRRAVFKEWLQLRRADADPPQLGSYFTAGWQTLLALAVLAGLGIGVSLTAGLLHYRGDEPVNVAWFFAWTVGSQLALLVFVLIAWLLRRTPLFAGWHPLQWLLGLLLWGMSAGLRRLPGEQRNRAHATIARVLRQHEIHRAVTLWPLLIVTQLFGVCFNLGVLGTLLLHVALSDVAFGWQSTLRTSATDAHRIATTVALPWKFAPNPHPSLEQVVASRFAYSEGIRPLSPAAMASWWPWLCYSVVVYGLLVRLGLLTWAGLKLSGALRAAEFHHPAANALFRELTGPTIQAQTDTAHLEIPALRQAPASRARTGSCLALIADDVSVEPERLTAVLQAQFGWTVPNTLKVQIDHPSGNAEQFAQVARNAAEIAAIVIVVRARRSPITAIALFLQKVANAAGEKAEVLVLLLGRREGDGFAPVSDEEFEHWRNFNAIHGLHLGLERWAPQ